MFDYRRVRYNYKHHIIHLKCIPAPRRRIWRPVSMPSTSSRSTEIGSGETACDLRLDGSGTGVVFWLVFRQWPEKVGGRKILVYMCLLLLCMYIYVYIYIYVSISNPGPLTAWFNQTDGMVIQIDKFVFCFGLIFDHTTTNQIGSRIVSFRRICLDHVYRSWWSNSDGEPWTVLG